jgi:hypothetical protein
MGIVVLKKVNAGALTHGLIKYTHRAPGPCVKKKSAGGPGPARGLVLMEKRRAPRAFRPVVTGNACGYLSVPAPDSVQILEGVG